MGLLTMERRAVARDEAPAVMHDGAPTAADEGLSAAAQLQAIAVTQAQDDQRTDGSMSLFSRRGRRQRGEQRQRAGREITQAEGEAEQRAETKLNFFQRRKQRRELEGSFESYPHLLALRPKESIIFHSDYFRVDSTSVGCVLAFFHNDSAHDGFAPFWGIDRIPAGLDDSVTTIVLEQVEKKDERWIEDHIKQSDKLEKLDDSEQVESGTTATRKRAIKRADDRDVIISEIQNGAAYLRVHSRLLIKAPTLEILEDSLDRIKRLYVDRFGTVSVAPYAGEQRQEMSALTKRNEKKRGRGFYFTSTEFAGSYSLVTNGISDRGGEYCGYIVGDVNNSAVLFDANRYESHVVIADSALSEYLDRQHVSNMWCSKLSQMCLRENGRVVHLVLDGTDLDKLGPKFSRLTSRVDMNSGDVNMFEMFGDVEDELAIFPMQLEKLTLMFEQLYESTDGGVGSIIRNELARTATDFYIDQGMWQHNAKTQRHRLRVVGIPHDQVPRLKMFVSYLETAHKALLNSERNDPDQLRAYNVLRGVAQNLLTSNGDLFNNITDETVDTVRDSRRVIYDFSHLMRRGTGVAMAQLVNVAGFAVGRLGIGDTVIIHGTENIDARVKEYLTAQLTQLGDRGGRIVYSYNSVDKMLVDDEFNRFDVADYTILGSMRERTVSDYQKRLHQSIPRDLVNLVTRRGENLVYLRRGTENAVFHLDLPLGINPAREAQRREMERAASRAEEAERFAPIMDGDLVPGAKLTGGGQIETGSADSTQDRVVEGGSSFHGSTTTRHLTKTSQAQRTSTAHNRSHARRQLTKETSR